MSLRSLLAFIAAAVTTTAPAQKNAQPGPLQQDVLHAMRLANGYFMTKWPDPGTQIVTNIARPSNIWTRAVYYEGLMALHSIDPKKEYLDYAIDWGNKHDWTPRNGVTNRNADDQCAGQTWIDLYNIDPRQNRISPIKASIDNMVHSDRRTTGTGSTPSRWPCPSSPAS